VGPTHRVNRVTLTATLMPSAEDGPAVTLDRTVS